MQPGDLLLCFSDGLVERPGEDLSIGLAELVKVASAALLRGTPSLRSVDPADRVTELTELTVERMTRQGYQDDVTLLAVRLTGQDADEFLADLRAEPGQLSMLRERLGHGSTLSERTQPTSPRSRARCWKRSPTPSSMPTTGPAAGFRSRV